MELIILHPVLSSLFEQHQVSTLLNPFACEHCAWNLKVETFAQFSYKQSESENEHEIQIIATLTGYENMYEKRKERLFK